MLRLFALLSFVIFSFPAPATAQMEDPIFKLEQNHSLLHISASEQREVDQDLLVATLRIESEDESNKNAQNVVNKGMAKALELAGDYDEVKAATRGYTVRQYDRNAGKRNMASFMVWKAEQSVELKSKNAEQLLELAGKIQEEGFVMAGLEYTLSPERAAQIQDEMLEAALEKLQNRAERAAKALGKDTAELKEINTEGNYVPQPRMMHARMEMSAMAADSMAAPVASPGETTLTMNVSAKAILK
ncbi:MAG: SIMPL domain-containing protein [Alphaproteobacteria bacterium]